MGPPSVKAPLLNPPLFCSTPKGKGGGSWGSSTLSLWSGTLGFPLFLAQALLSQGPLRFLGVAQHPVGHAFWPSSWAQGCTKVTVIQLAASTVFGLGPPPQRG